MDLDLLVIKELVSSSSSSSSSSSTSSSSSSSSSISSDQSFLNTFSDEDFFEIQKLYDTIERQTVKNFVQDVENYSDEDFRRYFRVSRKTATSLIEQFARSKHYKRRIKSGGRKATSPKTQCLSFLWFAGNKNTYREVAQLFDLSLSSAYRHQTLFLEFLSEISKNHIGMPLSNAEKESKSNGFAKIAGLPNVLGCMDSCSICIRNPAKIGRSTYKNSHGKLSITLQAICDADKRFLDVFVGASSKIPVSQVFQMSNISKDISKICGKTYHLLGDAAYPLREYLLPPYTDRDYGELSTKQEKFNKKHMQTMQIVDNSFRLLKQRFRQLTHLDFFTVSRMSKFVLGCCVLHNLCIDEGDYWIEEHDIDNEIVTKKDQTEANNTEIEEPSMLDNISLHMGDVKRNELAETL